MLTRFVIGAILLISAMFASRESMPVAVALIAIGALLQASAFRAAFSMMRTQERRYKALLEASEEIWLQKVETEALLLASGSAWRQLPVRPRTSDRKAG